MKRHDENARFVPLFYNSLVVIDIYFIVKSNVLGKTADTVITSSPTWTHIIGFSVYFNFFPLPHYD